MVNVCPCREFTYKNGKLGPAHACAGRSSEENTEYQVRVLHVEYAEREKKHGILFIFSLLCEYTTLEYERVHVIDKVS